MPFGLALALRLATKMMAPVIRYLRSRGLRLAIYIDDLILISRSYKESIEQTQLLVDKLHRLRHSSLQMPSNPLPIGRVFGHTGEQQEDAVPSASRQDSDLLVEKFGQSSPKMTIALSRYGSFAASSAS
jgi:hypothetical protein